MHFRLPICAAVIFFGAASAQAEVFSNPFAEATVYRAARGEMPDSTLRLRYEVSSARSGAAPTTAEIVIDVASNWAVVHDGAETRLHDFRLNRRFTLDETAHSFSSRNDLDGLAFRVAERQNRIILTEVVRRAGATGVMDDCDADSELGLTLPNAPHTATSFRALQASQTLHCGTRDIGGFEPGTGAPPPAAFWPTMAMEMTTHPALFARFRADGHAPARLAMSLGMGTSQTQRAWRLMSSESLTTPYPLDAGYTNTTAADLDRLLGPGAGQLAADAVAGRAQGGPPTLEGWGQHLTDLSRRDPIAAGMLLAPTFNMFPELGAICQNGGTHPACAMTRGLRALPDPAPIAVFAVGAAEQQRNPAAALQAMQAAQSSPMKDDPALGAAFALALHQFNEPMLARARAANIPVDIAALQTRALLAFPYSPAYWTDSGERYFPQYDFANGLLLYDVAFSLPMPSAVAAMAGKRDSFARLQRDFPDFGLPR